MKEDGENEILAEARANAAFAARKEDRGTSWPLIGMGAAIGSAALAAAVLYARRRERGGD